MVGLGDCRLEAARGRSVDCRGARCPFWDGNACLFECVDLGGRAEVAEWLLSLRQSLEGDGARSRRRAGAGRE
jgi:hypothetical protein